MNRQTNQKLLPLAILAAFGACSGSSDTAGIKTGGDFIVLKTEPSDNATLFLNDSIRIDFSNPIDVDSVNLSTFSFEVRDQLGNVVAEPVAGSFALGTSPGDTVAGRRLLFEPRLPTNDLFTNGGFRPGRTYVVQLVGGDTVNGTVLRDSGGKGLAVPVSFRFHTSDGTTPGQLFRNTLPGGPRRTGFVVTPAPEQNEVVLNKLGAPPLEIRLKFDQPLNPNSSNVPVAVDTNPLTRNSNNRGRVFLEYDDVELGDNVWIPADVELEENKTSGSTIVLRPLGVLPNNAVVRVIVERTLEDISGESNVANGAYDRIFQTFRVKRSYEQQFDAVVDDFTASELVDLAAAFPEPTADVGPGYLKAGFSFEGTATQVEFDPAVPETILNTDFTQVTPKTGAPFNVSGGVFNFKSVRIGPGKVVRGQGSKPMVWLVSGNFEVAGTLSVRGGDGAKVTSSGNANVPKAGGAGACGGGDGGAGSPSTTLRDAVGGTGNGPLQSPDQGGVGGLLSCTAGCNRGAGGGGGSFATQGDPNFKVKTLPPNIVPIPPLPFVQFQQQTGLGGNGCLGVAGIVTRSLQGGSAGPTVFVDARNDNNFWGVGVRFDGTPLRITGELALPAGGGGGGGGGDLSYNSSCTLEDVNFENDSSGGGGGGGGGVLIVKALGSIIVADGGRITADGGSGGGGEQSASCSKGGGGGGGAGGMVVLMSATGIDINVRGAAGRFRYAENDYDFAVSADGGSCVTSNFQAPVVLKKYQPTNPTTGQIASTFGTLYDSAPLGGLGGMGVVQLMAPPGVPGVNPDGTNTILDDNIRMFQGGVPQSGNSKRLLLAWRGFPNQLGQGVDDTGAVITPAIGDDEGDIRPSPLLLPTPIAAKTRLRSQWIDTGFTARRSLLQPDELPRGITDPTGTLRGPTYEFSGVNTTTGYALYDLDGSVATSAFTTVVAATTIESKTDSSFQGDPAYRVVLQTPALGNSADRYIGYEADALDGAGALLRSFRILSHTDSVVLLATEAGSFPAGAASLRVRAKFFDIMTNGVAGPNFTYLGFGGDRVPVANVRIGFAFHQNPASPGAQRYPTNPNEFTYQLSDPAVQEQIRVLGASFVQWDILFDLAFKRALPPPAQDGPPPIGPETARPELHFLRVPYRF